MGSFILCVLLVRAMPESTRSDNASHGSVNLFSSKDFGGDIFRLSAAMTLLQI